MEKNPDEHTPPNIYNHAPLDNGVHLGSRVFAGSSLCGHHGGHLHRPRCHSPYCDRTRCALSNVIFHMTAYCQPHFVSASGAQHSGQTAAHFTNCCPRHSQRPQGTTQRSPGVVDSRPSVPHAMRCPSVRLPCRRRVCMCEECAVSQ